MGGNFHLPFISTNYKKIKPRNFDDLNWFGFHYYNSGQIYRTMYSKAETMNDPDEMNMPEIVEDSPNSSPKKGGNEQDSLLQNEKSLDQVRKNFSETAFFYPALKPDSDGKVNFSFTVPDALTKWKFQALVVSKDLKIGLMKQEVISTKELINDRTQHTKVFNDRRHYCSQC